MLATGNLRPVSRVRGAHLVFVTAVTFSAESSALLSVSGDASARVTIARPASGNAQFLLLLAIFVAIVAVLVQLLRQLQLETIKV